MNRTIIYLLIFITFPILLSSQNIRFFDINTSNYPTVSAKFYAFDTIGKKINNFSKSDFSIQENGENRTITKITCDNNSNELPLSVVLTIDVSTSMDGKGIELVQNGAITLINSLNYEKSECAITSFNGDNTIEQDFTHNKYKLLKSINNLKIGGNTDFNDAFYLLPAGALPIAKNGINKKIIIMITDGLPIDDPNTDEILSYAHKIDASIFCIVLFNEAPSCLKKISLNTGGEVFDKIVSKNDVSNIYQLILQKTYNVPPCEIEWKSNAPCDYSLINGVFNYRNNFVIDSFEYDIPMSKIAKLEYSLNGIYLSGLKAGDIKDTNVNISSKLNDFSITKIWSEFSNLVITPQSVNLKKGDLANVNFRYTCLNDSIPEYIPVYFEINGCKTKQFIIKTLPINGNMVDTTSIKIEFPNGKEKLVIGSDTTIRWSGCMPNDNIKLEYSFDSGASWKLLTDSATQYNYIWRNIPYPISQYCMIRGTINNTSNSIPILSKYSFEQYNFSNDSIEVNADLTDDGSKIILDVIPKNANRNVLHTFNLYEFPSMRFLKNIISSSLISFNLPKYWFINQDASTISIEKNYDTLSIFNINSNTSTFLNIEDYDSKDISMTEDLDYVALRHRSYAPVRDSMAIIRISDKKIVSKFNIYTNEAWVPYNFQFSPDNSSIFISYIAASPSPVQIIKYNWQNGEILARSQYKDALDISEYFRFNHDYTELWVGRENSKNGLIVLDANSLQIKDKISAQSLNYFNALYCTSSINDNLVAIYQASDYKFSDSVIIFDKYRKIILGKLFISDNELFEPNLLEFSLDNKTLFGIAPGGIHRWELNKLAFTNNSDVSDTLFSIVAPNIIARDIDLGKAIVKTSKDSVVTKFIINSGAYPIRIDSIRVKYANVFNAYGYNSSIKLSPGESLNCEFVFSPNKLGQFSDSIYIYTQSGIVASKIIGEGVEPTLNIVYKNIDFGDVHTYDIKDTTIAVIENITQFDVFIKSMKLLGSDFDQFTCSDYSGFKLSAGEKKELKLSFKPIRIGRTNSDLGIYYDATGSPATIRMAGRGIGGVVKIVSDSAYSGEKKSIKLNIDNLLPGSKKNIGDRISSTLVMNGTLLTPLDQTLIDRRSGDSIFVKFNKQIDTTKPSLTELDVIAGLGKVESTPIIISNIDFFDANGNILDYEVEIQNGTFKLLGICREGGTRLVNPNSQAQILSVRPNPATNAINIEYQLTEKGGAEFLLINDIGETVKQINYGEISDYSQRLETIKLDDLANGRYTLILKTPTISERRSVVVVR